MSDYIDEAYYFDTFKGTGSKQGSEINSLITKASNTVNILTNYQLVSGKNSFDSIHETQRDIVKKAVATLVEHYVINGGYEAVQQANISNVKIGNFNYSKSKVKDVPDSVISLLSFTGLMYAGIGGV